MSAKEQASAALRELLFQALETEQGGIQVYETALRAAVDEDLREEWEEYLEETRTHEQLLLSVFEQLDMDPTESTPGREVVHHIGQALVKAMEMAMANADAEAAQIVAGECVVLAETKDHMNWELIEHLGNHLGGKQAKVLKSAHEEIGDDEDHHLYHTKGWTREMWIRALGLPAVLPPPEEVKSVATAIGASRAEQQRDDML